MLRVLAQRGEQGYDDLASLMGLSVGEVRAKAIGALAQLEAEGEPVPDIPVPAGEPNGGAAAEPAAPASEPEKPAEPPPAAPEPEEVVAPAEPAPAAVKPPAPSPAPTQSAAPAAEKPKASSGGRQKLSLPKDRGVRAAIGAGLLAIVAIVVILIVGGSGGSGGSEPSASGSGETGTAANASESSRLTQATLSPVGGGSGEGRAIFGRVKKNVVLQVEAKGLEPSPKGSAYTIWLYKSPQLALRVGAVRVTQNGAIAVQLPLPTELLAYVASGAFNQIDIALTEDAAYAAEVAKSKQEKKLPEHVGASVLRGEITGPAVKTSESGG